jgi:hypothetical protein
MASLASSFGIDPRLLQAMMISNALGNFSQGVMQGHGLGQGIARGFANAGAGTGDTIAQAARMGAYESARRDAELRRAEAERQRKAEEAQQAAREKLAAKMLEGLPPSYFPAPPFGTPRTGGAFDTGAPRRAGVFDTNPETLSLVMQAYPDNAFDIYKQIYAPTPHALTHITQRQGNMERGAWADPYTGEVKSTDGDWSPRFEGPQPPRMPLDATVYEPTANGGKGGYVYVGGPYKGQLARPGPQATGGQPSAWQQRYDWGYDYAKKRHYPDPESWAGTYANGGQDYHLPDSGIDEVPLDEDGNIDESQMEVGRYYPSRNVITLSDGTQVPAGTPVRYLGNGQFELPE